MVEAVAEMDDELTHKYLEGHTLSNEDIKRGLRLGTLEYRIVPVLAGSALKNKGVQPVLDAVVDYLPSPLDVPPVIGEHPVTHEEVLRTANDNEPFSALAFKIAADPYVGKLAYFRVYSGHAQGRLVRLQRHQGQEGADRPHPPDARQPPRRDRHRVRGRHRRRRRPQGDLHRRHPERSRITRSSSRSIVFPEPVIEVAIEPKTKADQDKLGLALQRLAEEDPTFRVHTDEESGQTRIAGMGELHLDVLVDRMVREFKVAANVGRPRVSYRETIRQRRRRQLPPRQADRRQGPVRPRRHQDRAQQAGRGLRVRRQDRRRHHPAGIHQAHRHGHPRRPRYGPVRRVPDGRRQGDALRRLLPRSGLERNGVPDRRLDGPQGSGPQGRRR